LLLGPTLGEMSDGEPERSNPAIKAKRHTLLVGNLPTSRSPADLKSHLQAVFLQYGELKECEVIEDDSGSARGFAFVRLKDGRRAEDAKRGLDGTPLPQPEGSRRDAASSVRPMHVRWALDTHTLCVSDLSPLMTKEALQAAFSQFGTVLSCRIEFQPPEFNSHSKLFGFVEYSKRSTAAKVQQLLSENLLLLNNSPRPVRVDFAVDDGFDDEEGEPVAAGLEPPPPHFAVPGSLEFDFALRWRELALAHAAERERLDEVHRQEREVLRQEQADIYKHEREKMRASDNPVEAAMSGNYSRSEARPAGGGHKRPRQ